jgi:hypothetical protein
VPEGAVRLLLDEDVWQGLAQALRDAGYDSVSATEVGCKGLSDAEILFYAIEQNRALLTHNIRHFAPLAADYYARNIEHSGIIVSRRFEKGELLRRTLALLASLTPEALANTLRFT